MTPKIKRVGPIARGRPRFGDLVNRAHFGQSSARVSVGRRVAWTEPKQDMTGRLLLSLDEIVRPLAFQMPQRDLQREVNRLSAQLVEINRRLDTLAATVATNHESDAVVPRDLTELDSLYELDDRPLLANFLAWKTNAESTLLRLRPQLANYMGNSTHIGLKLIPGDDPQDLELYVVIRAINEPDEIFNRLNQFLDSWVTGPGDGMELLNFTVEFG